MTRLRKMMLEELERRHYSHRTAKTYTRIVCDFAQHFHCAPNQLGPEQIRQYQAHLFQVKRLAPATVSQYASALRFFFLRISRFTPPTSQATSADSAPLTLQHHSPNPAPGRQSRPPMLKNPSKPHSSPRPPQAASAFVQIPLSQVPRRDTSGLMRMFGVGALVDRVLGFFTNRAAKNLATVKMMRIMFNVRELLNHDCTESQMMALIVRLENRILP